MKTRKAALAFILITVTLDMVAVSSMRAIAMAIGPGLFSFTFAWFINGQHRWVLPVAPWYLAAAMLFVAMALAFTVEQPEMTKVPAAASAAEARQNPHVA